MRVKKKQKRGYRRKRPNAGMLQRSVMLPLAGIPDKMRAALRYTDNKHVLTTGLSAYSKAVFRAGGAYDPDLALGGNSPINFGIFATLYNHYRVIKSSVRIIWTNGNGQTSPDTQAHTIAVVPSNGNGDFSGISQVLQAPYCRSKYSSNVPGFPIEIKHSMTAKRIRGASNLQKDSYEAQTQGSPAACVPLDDWYWNIWIFNNEGTGPVYGSYRIFITYDIEFYERKEMPLTFHGPSSDVPCNDLLTEPVVINGGDDNAAYLYEYGQTGGLPPNHLLVSDIAEYNANEVEGAPCA